MSMDDSDSSSEKGSEYEMEQLSNYTRQDRKRTFNPLGGKVTVHSQLERIFQKTEHHIIQQELEENDIPPNAVALRASSMFVLSSTNPLRIGCYKLIKHWLFETFIILAIIVNCVFLAIDDPTQVEKPGYYLPVEVTFTIIFSIEMILKIFALGVVLHKGSYFRDSWNILDFTIVCLSYLNFIPDFGNFTAFRTLRVMKPLRSMNAIKGLKILVTGLFHSFGGLVHVLVLAAFIFCIFVILGVQLWGGLFRKRCASPVYSTSDNSTIESWIVEASRFCRTGAPDYDLFGVDCPPGQSCIDWNNPKFGYLNFDHVGAAFLVIFQVITFEGWTEVLQITSYTWGRFSIVYFFCLIMIGSYFIPNLALAVINDKFNDAQEKHREFEEEEKKKLDMAMEIREKGRIRLRGKDKSDLEPTVVIDPNETQPLKARGRNGSVLRTPSDSHLDSTVVSLTGGWTPQHDDALTPDAETQSKVEMEEVLTLAIPSTLQSATTSPNPQENLNSGDGTSRATNRVPSKLLRVRNSVHKFTEGYPLLDPTLLQEYTYEELKELDEDGSPTVFTKVIIVAIVLNTIFLSIYHFGQPLWVEEMLQVANYVFIVVFALELCIRLFALGPILFVRDPFNVLDAVTVITSFVELGLSGSNIASVFRALRLLRVLKLIKRFPSLRFIIRVALGALEHTIYLNLIMFIYLFIAALAGMQFFGGKMDRDTPPLQTAEDNEPIRQHFDNFLRALYTVFQVLTRDDWVNVMYGAMEATSEAAVLYFIVIVIVGNYIILSLFLAILISSFKEEEDPEDDDSEVDDQMDLQAQQHLEDIREKITHETGEHFDLLPPEDPTGKLKLSEEIKAELVAAQEQQGDGFLLRRQSSLNPTGFNQAMSKPARFQGPGNRSPPGSNIFRDNSSRRGSLPLASIGGGRGGILKKGGSTVSAAVVNFNRPSTSQRVSTAQLQAPRCEVCKERMFVPLVTPPLIPPFDIHEYHQRHCWLMAIRSSKRQVLSSLLGLVQIKSDGGIPFSEHLATKIVEQAHAVKAFGSFDSTNHDLKTWDAFAAELNAELDVLELKPGEEAVGGALKTYVHASMPKEHHTNGGESLFCLGPKNKVRVAISEIVNHRYFERFILACIMVSCITLAIDNPRDNKEEQHVKYSVLFAFDVLFTTIFIAEMALKIIAKGFVFHQTAYMRDPWNILDAAIVLISVVSLGLQDIDIGWIKVFRALRGLRPLRVIQRNRGLKMVVRTLLQSVVGIVNVALLSSLNYLIFGILGVQIWGGKLYECNDETIIFRVNCTGSFVNSDGRELQREWQPFESNFDNIFNSILTLFEVSVGEGWGQIMYNAIDADSHDRVPIKDNNEAYGLFFIVFFIISNFFLLNLFVGVVINNFNSVKSKMDGLSILSDQQKLWVETQRLMLNFRPQVFLRPNRSSKVSVLCHNVVKSWRFEAFISLMIMLNVVTIAMDHHGMSPTWEETLQAFNVFFALVFLGEAIFKLAAYRLLYFTNGWNRFDFLLVVLSVVGLCLYFVQGQELPIDPALLRVFRIFRLFRVLRLVKRARHVQVLIETLWYSLPSIGNISIFMLLIYFIFGVLGIQFFSKVQPGEVLDDRFMNFHNFPNALQVMFIMTTGEDWNSLMHDCMVQEPNCVGDGCGHPWAPVFFVPFMLTSAFVISQLFIAIILDNFDTTMKLDQSSLKLQDLHRYVEIWSEFDEDATMVIDTHLFPRLLARLRPPLGISRAYGRSEIIDKTLQYRVPEHGGKIHFVETLIPLARIVMKVNFSKRELREHEEMWRRTFPDLMEFPILRYRQEMVTVEKYFCSTYIAAAYRRKKARQQIQKVSPSESPEKMQASMLAQSQARSPQVLPLPSPPISVPDGGSIWVAEDRTKIVDF